MYHSKKLLVFDFTGKTVRSVEIIIIPSRCAAVSGVQRGHPWIRAVVAKSTKHAAAIIQPKRAGVKAEACSFKPNTRIHCVKSFEHVNYAFRNCFPGIKAGLVPVAYLFAIRYNTVKFNMPDIVHSNNLQELFFKFSLISFSRKAQAVCPRPSGFWNHFIPVFACPYVIKGAWRVYV